MNAAFQQLSIKLAGALHDSYYGIAKISDEEKAAHMRVEHTLYGHLSNEFARVELSWAKGADHAEKLRKLNKYAYVLLTKCVSTPSNFSSAIGRPNPLVRLSSDPSTKEQARK